MWTDVDMTYPNDEIPMMVKELDGYDHIVGARRTEEGTQRFLRVPAKWFIRKLASYLTDTDIPDLNSGLRAFRRDVAMQYVHHLPAGFSCVTTLTMSFLANGYSIKYVPIDYSPAAGTSKFHWWRDTKRYLLQVVRMSLSYNPLRVFLPLGADVPDDRHGQARLRLDRQGLPSRRQHAADPAGVVAGDHHRPARRPRRACNQAAHASAADMTTGTADVPTGNTYDKYGSTNPIEQRMIRGFLRRARRDARRTHPPARARGRRRRGRGDGSLRGASPARR